MIFEGNLIANNAKFAIVISRFNNFITTKLLEGALEAFTKHAISNDNIDIIWVPGAFEIPLICKKIAQTQNYNAIITLGAIIKGETNHYEYVCNETAKGIANISLTFDIPIIFGVLTTLNANQALERTGIKLGNKGYDATISAIEMVNLYNKINQSIKK